MNGQIRWLVAGELLGVGVDTDQSSIEREAIVEDDVVVGLPELGTDGEYHVGVAGKVAYGGERGGGTEIQRVPAAQQALRVDGGDGGCIQRLRQGTGGVGGIDATAAE